MATIYKICAAEEWDRAVAAGSFAGSAVDLRDGFIHLSTKEQVRETAARHFAGQSNLLVIAFDGATLGQNLRYEPSRDGALFPHFYGQLPCGATLWVEPLPRGASGAHVFPERMD